MPSRNTVKDFTPNSYYHLYNRGVDKRRIFEDSEDYQKFLYYLKVYLTPSVKLHEEMPLLRKNLTSNNLAEEVTLLAFCLMPNHFHLLLHQESTNGITRLMRQLTTAYSMYFNKRYERIGPLFQGIYKAVNVKTEDLLALSSYIHVHPEADRGVDLNEFKWSSFLTYSGSQKLPWIETETVNEAFKKTGTTKSYRDFVKQNNQDLSSLSNLILDQD